MTDNFPFTPGSGLTGSADDIGGVLVQRVKVQHGADGSAADVSTGAGLPVAGQYLELSGTAAALNADGVASTDVRGFSRFSVQVSGTWTGTFNIQGSNDNTNWFTYFNVWAINGTGSPTANITSNGIYNGVITARYLRVRMTAYTSGTATVTTELTNTPGDPNVSINSGAALSVSVGSPGSPSDGATVSTSQVQVSPSLYNGTTMDRARTASSANATSGTGVPAAGLLGYDTAASQYRRILADSDGGLLTAAWLRWNNSGANLTAAGSLVYSGRSRVGGWVINNKDSTNAVWVNVSDATSYSPTWYIYVPANTTVVEEFANGVLHNTGIYLNASDAQAGSTRATGLLPYVMFMYRSA